MARPELADVVDLPVLLELDHALRRVPVSQRDGEEFADGWYAVWDVAEEHVAEEHYFTTIRPRESFAIVFTRA